MTNKKRSRTRKHRKENPVLHEGSSEDAKEDEITASLQRICDRIHESNNLLYSLTTELLKATSDVAAEVSAIQNQLSEGEQHVKALFDAFSSLLPREGSAQSANQDSNRTQPRGGATRSEKPPEQGNNINVDISSRKKGKRKAEEDEEDENYNGHGRKKPRQDSFAPTTSQRASRSASRQDGSLHEPVRSSVIEKTIEIITSDDDESDDSYSPSSSDESDSTAFSDASALSSLLSDYSSSDSDGDQPTHPGSYFPNIQMPPRPLPNPRPKPLRRDYETLFDLGGGSVMVFRDRIAESWWSAAPYQRHTSMEEDFELITEDFNSPFEFSTSRP